METVKIVIELSEEDYKLALSRAALLGGMLDKKLVDAVRSGRRIEEPCEDCISRQAVIELCEGWWLGHTKEDDFATEIRALPPVNPQKPKTSYISIDDVMLVFDVFMYGEVDKEGAETFLEMLKDKAESEVKE